MYMITTKCLKIEIIIMRHKRLAKFALIKYRINFRNYCIYITRKIDYILIPFYSRSIYFLEFRERLNNTKILSRELVKMIYCML